MNQLYTTECPHCQVLELLLTRSKIPFTKILSTAEDMMDRGWQTAPMLILTDGTEYNLHEAVKWVRQENNK